MQRGTYLGAHWTPASLIEILSFSLVISCLTHTEQQWNKATSHQTTCGALLDLPLPFKVPVFYQTLRTSTMA